jgi:hypothetical protein
VNVPFITVDELSFSVTYDVDTTDDASVDLPKEGVVTCNRILSGGRIPSHAHSRDGLYDILVMKNSQTAAAEHVSYKLFCDMTRDGGGWTLVLTSIGSDWKDETIRLSGMPSLTSDYSILAWADRIKASGIGNTFEVSCW